MTWIVVSWHAGAGRATVRLDGFYASRELAEESGAFERSAGASTIIAQVSSASAPIPDDLFERGTHA